MVISSSHTSTETKAFNRYTTTKHFKISVMFIVPLSIISSVSDNISWCCQVDLLPAQAWHSSLFEGRPSGHWGSEVQLQPSTRQLSWILVAFSYTLIWVLQITHGSYKCVMTHMNMFKVNTAWQRYSRGEKNVEKKGTIPRYSLGRALSSLHRLWMVWQWLHWGGRPPVAPSTLLRL